MTSQEPIHPDTRSAAWRLYDAGLVPRDIETPAELYNHMPWPEWAILVLCWTQERMPPLYRPR